MYLASESLSSPGNIDMRSNKLQHSNSWYLIKVPPTDSFYCPPDWESLTVEAHLCSYLASTVDREETSGIWRSRFSPILLSLSCDSKQPLSPNVTRQRVCPSRSLYIMRSTSSGSPQNPMAHLPLHNANSSRWVMLFKVTIFEVEAKYCWMRIKLMNKSYKATRKD